MQHNLPDLSDLDSAVCVFLTRRITAPPGIVDPTVYNMALGLMRLVDLAVTEYESARGWLEEWRMTTGTGVRAALAATGSFEACIWALDRAQRLARSIRSNKEASTEVKQLLPKTLGVLVASNEKLIREFRDNLSHLDERLRDGRIGPGEPICASPEPDYIQIGTSQLHYTHLAGWLRELHACAMRLAIHRDPDTRGVEGAPHRRR